ncbi:hypothetical protein AB0O97_16715, partial [Specibacter sp. NPDC078692]
DPKDAAGLDGALKALAALPFGEAILIMIGVGRRGGAGAPSLWGCWRIPCTAGAVLWVIQFWGCVRYQLGRSHLGFLSLAASLVGRSYAVPALSILTRPCAPDGAQNTSYGVHWRALPVYPSHPFSALSPIAGVPPLRRAHL